MSDRLQRFKLFFKKLKKNDGQPKELTERQKNKAARRQLKIQKKKARIEKRLNRPPWLKLLMFIGRWTLKIVVVLILIFIALTGGLMVGMGVVGDAEPREALNPDTWRHIYELIFVK